MRNQIQRELDRAEEYVLNQLFGDFKNPQISNKIKLLLIAKGINFDDYINEKLQLFEEFSSDFMTEDGYYNGEKLTKAILLRFPQLEGFNMPNIKPIELFKTINNLINLETIGKIIQNI
jgi:hypothetical protein